MPQGLQVFDPTGQLILDLSDRLARVLGTFNTGTSAGSHTDSALSTGTPWVTGTGPMTFVAGSPTTPPVFTISGNTISWTASPIDTVVIYGVY